MARVGVFIFEDDEGFSDVPGAVITVPGSTWSAAPRDEGCESPIRAIWCC
jgi:hypothetical protein